MRHAPREFIFFTTIGMSGFLSGRGEDRLIVQFKETLEAYTRSSKGGFGKREVGTALTSVAALAVCTTEAEAATLIFPVGEEITPGVPNNVLVDHVQTGAGFDFEFGADDDPTYPFVRMAGRDGI